MQKSIVSSLVVIFVSIAAFAAPVHAETLKFEGKKWAIDEYEGSAARVEDFLGRKALFLQRTVALLEGDSHSDVVIEYEYASTHPSGFIGVNFRADLEAGNLEQFYTRPHQTGHPDATQYMVMINGSATWQLHAGPNDAVATDLPSREWIKVRIVAIGDRADIFVGDMSKPLMHVPDLRHDDGEGHFSLYASDRPWMTETGAYFSNISVRAATKNDVIIGRPNETEPTPEGLLTQFEVSKPFAEKAVSGKFSLDGLDVLSGEWVLLPVENDGVANLARTTPLKPDANTVLVRFRVTSDVAVSRLLNFGYSDRIHLFVDGDLVYAGNAQWRARDHRFLGTVALTDSVALHLKAGETEIVAAISESFGGWGFKAQLQDQEGLEISAN